MRNELEREFVKYLQEEGDMLPIFKQYLFSILDEYLDDPSKMSGLFVEYMKSKDKEIEDKTMEIEQLKKENAELRNQRQEDYWRTMDRITWATTRTSCDGVGSITINPSNLLDVNTSISSDVTNPLDSVTTVSAATTNSTDLKMKLGCDNKKKGN